MTNYFQGSNEHPYHLSIGAVVINNENKICCHYFGDGARRKKFSKYSDFYLLMRESMEMGESIEQTLHRGLAEEFSMTGEIITFIGSLESGWTTKDNVWINKTTLYFLVKMKEHNPELRNAEDAEGESELEWQTADFLIPKMKEQAVRLDNPTMDESGVLERVKKILNI